MKKERNIKITRIILSIAIVVILGIFVWKMWPFMKELSSVEGQIAFKEKISELGFKGLLLLFTLQVLQILLVVLPGEPFEVLAGMCYGTWGRSSFYYYISIYYYYNNIFYSKKARKKVFV